MGIKEKIVRKSIKETMAEIVKIDNILNAFPIIDIIKLQKETIETAQRMKAGSQEVIKYLESQLKKEKALFRLAKKQENSKNLIERKTHLMTELIDLKNELYWIEQKQA